MSRSPLHVFPDILERLTPEARADAGIHQGETNMSHEQLQAYLIAKGADAFLQDEQGRQAGVECRHRLGAVCLRHGNHGCDRDGQQPRLQRLCCLKPPKSEALHMEVAGATCVAWSPVGKRQGVHHSSSAVFSVWAASTRLLEPDLIVFECSSKFPPEHLAFWFEDKYDIIYIDHPGPTALGWPVHRPRLYSLLSPSLQALGCCL